MRKRGLLLALLGTGVALGARSADEKFRTVRGRLATAFSSKWRNRRDLVRAGGRLGTRAAVIGALWALLPGRRKSR